MWQIDEDFLETVKFLTRIAMMERTLLINHFEYKIYVKYVGKARKGWQNLLYSLRCSCYNNLTP